MSDRPNPSLPSVPGDPHQTTDLPDPNPVPADQTDDFHPLPPADPQLTTDLPAPAHAAGDTGREGDTSVAPGGPSGDTATYHPPPTFDPARTGAYEPASGADTGEPTDANLAANGPTIPGYEILGELGRGGMGVVYKARQIGLNRVVAVKMILAGPNASPAVIARFRAEAQAVARFQHPNLVQVFEVGEFAGMPFFSLEFVAGGTLAKKIAREPQPPRYAAETVEKLARAMQYAHDRGIAHRDLKPANILMAPDGTPKITDFGLAKELEGDSGQTQSGQIMGTPSYMAPEQAEGRPDVGHPADVYALGAILYDLLTGRPPFAGSSVLDTLEMVRTREPVPPSELTGTLPRDLETICLKALQKDLAKRYASARDLADDLRRFLDGRPILARPVGKAEKAWRWARRNPAGALAVALGLALLVVPSVLSGFLFVAEAKATESAKKESDAKELAQGKQKEAEEALQKAREARAAEEEAKNRETIAKGVAVEKGKLAVKEWNGVLLTVRDVMRLVDNRMRWNSNLAPTRLQILELMLTRLGELRLPDENSVIDARTEGIGFSRIGLIYLDAGKPDEAARWVGRAHDLFRRLANEEPKEPVALLNLANVINQLADVEWRRGAGARVRELRVEALKTRQARAELLGALLAAGDKRVTPNSIVDAKFRVAESFVLVAEADLAAVDPNPAVENLRAAEKALAAIFPKGVPKEQWGALELHAKIQHRYGLAYFQQGRFEDALRCYRAAARDAAAIATVSIPPTDAIRIQGLALTARITLADFLLTTRNELDQASSEYAALLATFEAALKSQPENLPLRSSIALLHYRLGYVARQKYGATLGGSITSAAHYAACLRLRAELAGLDPTDITTKVEYMLALGRVGRTAEAERLASELLTTKALDERSRFQAVCGLAVAAGTATDEARAKALRERAFKELEPLVRNWKARGQLELDPDLDALRADPRFKQLMTQPQPK